MIARYVDAARSIGNLIDGETGAVVVVEPGQPQWAYFLTLGPSDAAPEDEPDALSVWRQTAVVSRFQAKAAILQAGLMPAVTAAVAAADDLTQLAWAEAGEFRRFSPAIMALATALGLSEAQVDDLFRAAALITA